MGFLWSKVGVEEVFIHSTLVLYAGSLGVQQFLIGDGGILICSDNLCMFVECGRFELFTFHPSLFTVNYSFLTNHSTCYPPFKTDSEK